MTVTLSPEQIEDAGFLAKGDACLFSEAGTGKTYTALQGLKQAQGRYLVTVPQIALDQWRDEAERMDMEPPAVAYSGEDLLRLTQAGVPAIVTTYRLMTTGAEALRNWAPKTLVFDESHAFIEPDSQRTVAALGARCRGDDTSLLHHAERAWFMTGTPQLRYPLDLWPTLRAAFPFVLQDLLGSKWKAIDNFRDRYCVVEPRWIYVTARSGKRHRRRIEEITAGQHEDEIHRALYEGPDPIARRRLLVDVDKHLPPRRERTINIGPVLDDTLDRQMAEAEKLFGEEALGEELMNADSESPVIRNLRRLFGVAKAREVIGYLTDIAEPTLVLTWHRDVAGDLMKAFAVPRGAAIIEGGTTMTQRNHALGMFANGDIQFLIGQIASMGTALDGLQKHCRRVVVVERIGSPALMEQALRRIWRRGQRESVQIDFIRAEHPLERMIDRTLRRKGQSQQRSIG